VATYNVVQNSIEDILSWVKTGRIAIPEIQRPFVWSTPKVRDLIDSLYQGYPIGYLITWQTGEVRLKDGSASATRQILIDGQQRVTALSAALVGDQILTKDYKRTRIQIAFNPISEKFETFTPVMKNNSEWIQDVSVVLGSATLFDLLGRYLDANPSVDRALVEKNLTRLVGIKNQQVGVIDLAENLDIETVTEIFVRINSTGARLTPADFAMSKIASYGVFGSNIRKFVDYFCHLSVAPHIYETIRRNDPEFAATDYFSHISWLKSDTSDLFDPSYQDLLRIAGMVAFGRGRMDAVVSYLSGRDFETRTFDEALAEQSFDDLERALFEITREYNFKQFRLILQSAGYVASTLLTSGNAVNFAYALFLRMRLADTPIPTIQSTVRRWFVMSMITGRNSGSFETQWEQDLRRMEEMGAPEYLETIERSALSDGYWEVGLPQDLVTSSTRSPYFVAFLAAQISTNARGFLSKLITSSAMLGDSGMGDLHHIFPKQYLIDHGINDRVDHTQVGNLVILETPINIRIGKLAPGDYMTRVAQQIESGTPDLGDITTLGDLERNLDENAIPRDLSTMDVSNYRQFLESRRLLISMRIRDFYRSL
jgi:hypothetical protein